MLYKYNQNNKLNKDRKDKIKLMYYKQNKKYLKSYRKQNNKFKIKMTKATMQILHILIQEV